MKNICDTILTDIPHHIDWTSVRQKETSVPATTLFEVEGEAAGRFLVYLYNIAAHEQLTDMIQWLHRAAYGSSVVTIPFDFGICDKGQHVYVVYPFTHNHRLLSEVATNRPLSNEEIAAAAQALHQFHKLLPEWVEYGYAHDYSAMLDNLTKQYESQPVRMTNEAIFFRFLTKKLPQACEYQPQALHLAPAPSNMLMGKDGRISFVDFTANVYGNPLYDLAHFSIFALQGQISPTELLLRKYRQGNPSPHNDWQHLQWFIAFLAAEWLVKAVNTCDESYINQVQRAITRLNDTFDWK